MPAPPPSPRSGVIWPLSNAHEVGQLVRVRCGRCPGKRYYEPRDLQEVLGDIDVNRLARRMRCERCGRGDSMDAEVFIPVASERVRIKVRRLVDIKTKRIPIWRDE